MLSDEIRASMVRCIGARIQHFALTGDRDVYFFISGMFDMVVHCEDEKLLNEVVQVVSNSLDPVLKKMINEVLSDILTTPNGKDYRS